MTTKSKLISDSSNNITTRGFLPDFSKYLFKDFPIETAYACNPAIQKLKHLVSELLTTKNPAQDLQNNGLCKKLEKMTPQQDRKFIQKCGFVDGQLYYAAYGRNPYRIILGIDTNQRIAYFFAIDTTHSVRKG